MFKNAACASFARASVAAALGGAAILLWSSAVVAAEETGATKSVTAEEKKSDTKTDQELSEVQVTGTRIQPPNVTSANPINTMTAEEMARLGIVNVADALTILVPQNISTYMPTMTGDDQAGLRRRRHGRAGPRFVLHRRHDRQSAWSGPRRSARAR